MGIYCQISKKVPFGGGDDSLPYRAMLGVHGKVLSRDEVVAIIRQKGWNPGIFKVLKIEGIGFKVHIDDFYVG